MTDEDPEPESGDAAVKEIFAAWWNGEDPPGQLTLPAILSMHEWKRLFLLWWTGGLDPEAELEPVETTGTAHRANVPRRKQQEINARGRVSQALWGEGNLTPGPAEFIMEITARLGLTSEMSMVDLGAGLGGPARAICAAYKIWITAYEAVPEYVKAGMEQSIMHGMGKKAPITQFETETFTLPEHKYDCVFSKEMMHHVQDKVRLLRQIQGSLKDSGQFCFTNYVITDAGKDTSHVTAWNLADGQNSHFWTKEEFQAAFAKAKLDLRVSEDLTARYSEMIAEGFRGLKKNMDNLIAEEPDPEHQSELLHALAFETNRWAVRAEALKSGAMALLRFSGINGKHAEIR